MLKRKPSNQYHLMLPYYLGKYEPKQNNIDFESAKDILMNEDDRMVVKRRFERIYNMMLHLNHIINTRIYLKTKKYLFVLSNLFKQIKSIIIF